MLSSHDSRVATISSRHETDEDDAIMMAEIKSYVKSHVNVEPKLSKGKSLSKIDSSPYAVNHLKIFERSMPNISAISDNKSDHHHHKIYNNASNVVVIDDHRSKRKEVRSARRRKKLPTNVDDLMNYYASLPEDKPSIAKDIIDTKQVTLPYAESTMKVQEFIHLDRSVRTNTMSFKEYDKKFTDPAAIQRWDPMFDTSKLTKISLSKPALKGSGDIASKTNDGGALGYDDANEGFMSRFHRKYPRFLKTFYFTDHDLLTAPLRSDVWMQRFMEDCYDESYQLCNTPISDPSKWRLRNGLDLGAMECFPKLVERVFNIRYSVLEVRTEICKQFLCSLEHFISVSDAVRLGIQPISSTTNGDEEEEESMYDGGRAQLFSMLLSEEYDLDVLALFLHVRETIQGMFRFRLRDMNASRVWINDVMDVPTQVPSKQVYAKKTVFYRTQQVHDRTTIITTSNATTTAAGSRSGILKKSNGGGTNKGNKNIIMERNVVSTSSLLDLKRSRSLSSSLKESSVQHNSRTMESSSDYHHRSDSLPLPSSSNARKGNVPRNIDDDDDDTNNDKYNDDDDHFVINNMKRGGASKKVVPVTLPSHWHYLRDASMPEAPLLGFNRALLALLCITLLPQHLQCNMSMRTYLTDRIIEAAQKSMLASDRQLKKKLSEGGGGMNRDVSSVIPPSADHDDDISTVVDKVVKVVPLYVLLHTLCREWKKLSIEAKVNFIEKGAGYESLRALHDIYKDNCELMRMMMKDIATTEQDHTNSESIMLMKEKLLRRLERKRVSGIATIAELEQIEDLRAELNEQRTIRMALEAKLESLIKRKVGVERDIEVLWKKATFGSVYKAKKSNEKTTTTTTTTTTASTGMKSSDKSQWQEVLNKLLPNVIQMNLNEAAALVEASHQKQLVRLVQSSADQVNHLSRTIGLIPMDSSDTSRHHHADIDADRDAAGGGGGDDVLRTDSEQTFFIIEVLSKVMTRNAIREGIRRVSLQAYLRIQQHQLLLLYGSEEYKQAERDRIRRVKEVEEQNRLYILRVAAAKRMSGYFVDDAVIEAKSRAEIALFDPWSLLDLDPMTWLPLSTCSKVEQLFTVSKGRYDRWCKRVLFHFISKDFRIQRFMNQRRIRVIRRCYELIVEYIHYSKQIDTSASRIQHMMKAFRFRLNFSSYMSQLKINDRIARSHLQLVLRLQAMKILELWHRQSSLSRRYKQTIFALTERRFIITFYIWRDQYKKHYYTRMMMNQEYRMACTKIQCLARRYIACKETNLLRVKRMIALLGKRYLSRKKVHMIRAYHRRLIDFTKGTILIREKHLMRNILIAWKNNLHILFGVLKLSKAIRNDMLRRRFMKWNKVRIYRNRILGYKITPMQSIIRMWLVHHRILKYYKFRRGLLAFQGICRLRPCLARYQFMIYFYRAAKKIQRIMRGYLVRVHITDSRVADIHYAAANNRYERLQYYINKYPQLVLHLDAGGNNALHSAAKQAAKRTIKLLCKRKMFDPNAPNQAGYTALHLVIASASPTRDECFFYLIERGFNDEIHGPDDKSSLLIAAEFGRIRILQHLLEEEDYNPNIADKKGTTCLQAACWQGNAAMVKILIDNDADVNMPGFNGSYPLHDCVHGGSVDRIGCIEIASMLIAQGAYVNVYDPYNYQTPLMWAAAAGISELVSLYLINGAEVNAKDINGQTAAHHGVKSNDIKVYNALREADADFDFQDNNRNTPLHLAAQSGTDEFAIHLLLGGAYASAQNNNGDQPSHIAARYNQLELLKQICKYDDHIGRLNYQHQTPLGVAKFYLSKECQIFLEYHYRMLEVIGDRNKLGELWWDKTIDDAVGDWEVAVDPYSTERYYMNQKTGEVSKVPPALSSAVVARAAEKAELPIHRIVTIVKEDNKEKSLSKHTYAVEFKRNQEELKDFTRDYVNATIIVKFARRKLAYIELKRLKVEYKRRKILLKWFRRHLPGFMAYRYEIYRRAAVCIQSNFRGYNFRRKFYEYPDGKYWLMRLYKAKWRLRYKLWSMWKLYLRRQEFKMMSIAANLPVTQADWQDIVDQARKPIRQVGMVEEYLFPNAHNICFYRNIVTGNCVFEKPMKMKYMDDLAKIEKEQIKKFGATIRQIELAKKLQAIFRGHVVRKYNNYMASAVMISHDAERKYFYDPDHDLNLFNYALHCFVFLQDINRSRQVFIECLRRMQWRGPDIPSILYAYSIFALVAHDEDYMDVMLMRTRARKAEEEVDTIRRSKMKLPPSTSIAKGTFQYGRCFDLADAGFFKQAALTTHTSLAWQSMGVCRFIVYDDFNSSIDAFTEAFRYAPEDKMLMTNFTIMMKHFHGPSKLDHDEIMLKRMQYHAQVAADAEESRRIIREAARKRKAAVKKIEAWYQRQVARIAFERDKEIARLNRRRTYRRG